MTIRELCIKYRCDKGPEFGMSYADTYDKLFKDFKPKKVLEIGVGVNEIMGYWTKDYINGAGLYVLRDYFPDAQIYGIDIHPSANVQDERIETFHCDQSSELELELLVKKIGKQDLIIDDGSHKTNHQITSAKVLLPTMNKGGLYIIEDVREPDKILKEFPQAELFEFDIENKPDDRLIVIKT